MFGFLTLGTTLSFLDLGIKAKVEEQEDGVFPKDLEETGGRIRIYKNHNPGFSFGVLKEYPKVVEMVPVCVTSALFGMWLYLCGRRGKNVKKLGLTLALAGGASNLYDRLKRGYVVDYVNVQWGVLKKLVFNLADVLVVLGAALFGLAELWEAFRERKG